MKTFFTSDPHFYHKNVIAYCNRPFDCVESMNNGLIENWNSVVGDGDEVYILGDFAFAGKQKIKEIVAQLKGTKHLILGNHDWKTIKEANYKDLGFADIAFSGELYIGKHLVKMSHFPYTGDSGETERFTDKRLKDEGNYLLHGHVHTSWKQKDRQINVGCDVWDWKPVSIEELEVLIK